MATNKSLYAHIFFDQANGKIFDRMPIVIYKNPQAPIFNKVLSPEQLDVIEMDQISVNQQGVESSTKIKGQELIKNIFSEPDGTTYFEDGEEYHNTKVILTPEELKSGGILMLTKERMTTIVERMKELGELEIARSKPKTSNRPTAQVVIDIDDPSIWLDYEKSREQKNFKPSDPSSYATKAKEKNFPLASIYQDIKDKKIGKSELQNILEELYTKVARTTNPAFGQQQQSNYAARSLPPSLLYSKALGVIYYPGQAGAPNLAQKYSPESSHVFQPKNVSNHKPNKKWASILVSDVKRFGEIELSKLDLICRKTAKHFWAQILNISPTSENNASDVHFDSSSKSSGNFAEKLLEQVGEKTPPLSQMASLSKQASDGPGVWINLETGVIYKTESELLAAPGPEMMPSSQMSPTYASMKRLCKLAKNLDKRFYDRIVRYL